MNVVLKPIDGGPYGGLLALHLELDDPDPDDAEIVRVLEIARDFPHVRQVVLDARSVALANSSGLQIESLRSVLADFGYRTAAVVDGQTKPIWLESILYKVVEVPAGGKWLGFACHELRVDWDDRDTVFVPTNPEGWAVREPVLLLRSTPEDWLDADAAQRREHLVASQSKRPWRFLPDAERMEVEL